MTPAASSSAAAGVQPTPPKKKRRRSEEAAARKRQRYREILARREALKSHNHNGGHIGRNHVGPSAPASAAGSARKICKYYYRDGSCVHGAGCAFSHDCVPLSSKDIKLCRFYLQGPSHCRFSAAECRYSHDPGLFLCRRNVLSGECDNPSSCEFKHMDAGAIAALDDAEKLKFCYNNKRFLTTMLLGRLRSTRPAAGGSAPADTSTAKCNDECDDETVNKLESMEEAELEAWPWYLQLVRILLLRDHERSDDSN